ALWSGHGALDEEQATLQVREDHEQVEHRLLLGAHVAGHLLASPGLAGRRARAHGTGRAMPVRLAVRLRAAAEVPALHTALETATLRGGRHVDVLPCLEFRDRDLLPGDVARDVLGAELLEHRQRCVNVRPAQVTALGTIEALAVA